MINCICWWNDVGLVSRSFQNGTCCGNFQSALWSKVLMEISSVHFGGVVHRCVREDEERRAFINSFPFPSYVLSNNWTCWHNLHNLVPISIKYSSHPIKSFSLLPNPRSYHVTRSTRPRTKPPPFNSFHIHLLSLTPTHFLVLFTFIPKISNSSDLNRITSIQN